MPKSNNPTDSLAQMLARGERPFPACAQVSRYFPATAIEEARKRLTRAIERGDGPGLIVGAAGTGKSLLLQVLAAQFHERFDVVLLACARICTRRALLQAILFELGLPYRSRDEGELRLSLLDQLLSGEPSTIGLLLLVDEAQNLSAALLDELRVLTNTVRGGAPRVRLVLAGSPALEENFANPELESFAQRLAARTYLSAFARQETSQYIRAQVAASGGVPDQIFTADALDAIFDATDGTPRPVNQLCDRALLFSHDNGLPQIDAQVVQSAWSDLQQLPTSWAASASHGNAASRISPAVEFGSLAAFAQEGDIDAAAIVDSDLTELDIDDESVDFIPRKQISKETATPSKRVAVHSTGSDPFAEEFDEEELVLDNFAAWDEVICSRTPRVENRRDFGFASRVRDAMLSVDQTIVQDHAGEDALTERRATDDECVVVDESADLSADEEENSNWPPIRLAVVADSPRLTPVPLIAPPDGIATTGSAAFDPVWPEDDEAPAKQFSSFAPCVRTGGAEPRSASTAILTTPSFATWPQDTLNSSHFSMPDDDPVLIIEADIDEPKHSQPPVRRESYRNLFSRLRSG